MSHPRGSLPVARELVAEGDRRRRRRWWSPLWLFRHLRRRLRRVAARGHLRKVVVGLLLLLGVLAFVLGASAWRDLKPARAEILAARAQLKRVIDPSAFATPALRDASRNSIATAERELASAGRRLHRSPGIWAAQFVPGLRRQRAGLLAVVDDTRRGASAATALLDRVRSMAGTGQLRDGAIPLDAVRALAVETGRAGRVFRGMQRSAAGLWGPLGSARRRLDEVAASTATRLTQVSEALGASQSFLGGNGERRYLVAIQNNAEMRDQGMVLSYGVLRFANGRFQFERRGSVADLRLDAAAATPIPPGTQEVFGSTRPTALWQSVNATADFEWSARAMVDMYRQATGQRVDGVVTIDVPGLAGLLQVVGPVAVAGVAEPISAGNAGRILLHDLYEGLAPDSSQSERRERLHDVAGAVIDRMAVGSRDLVSLGTAMAQASTGGHLRLWSAMAAEESTFVRTGLGGGPAASEADRTFHLAVENATSNKLDYYVKPTVRQDVRLERDGTAVVRTTVVVDNRAPTGARPSYALGAADPTRKPGDYLAWVLLWSPSGSTQATAATGESGLRVSQNVAAVRAGQKREFIFTTTVPHAVRNGRLVLRLVPQARLEPMTLEVHLQAPGWSVAGARDWSGAWDQVRRLTWTVDR